MSVNIEMYTMLKNIGFLRMRIIAGSKYSKFTAYHPILVKA